MHVLAALLGLVAISTILVDAFEVIILPRRVVRRLRLSVAFLRTTWGVWRSLAGRIPSPKRREGVLALYGPLSLLMLLHVWALGCMIGFALWMWGAGVHLAGVSDPTFGGYLYLSGVTFFTLGYGDVVPTDAVGRLTSVVEVGTGFGLIAIVIGYLPVVYQGFSRRETAIALLDARAGSPPSAEQLVLRYSHHKEAFEALLREWEQWSAELLESHLSYPVLGLFRSQHANQSWLGALTAIMDACVLVLAELEDGPAWQAQLTFAMARHAVVDLAQVYSAPPERAAPERLSPDDLAGLRSKLLQQGVRLRAPHDDRVQGLRAMYEPYIQALAEQLRLNLPAWNAPAVAVENWQTSPWERLTGTAIRTLLGAPGDPH
ncbi:MAG TPA: potassium channel family protein [Candidatus Xenobia bacterium]